MSHPQHTSQIAALSAWGTHFQHQKPDLAYNLARKALATCPRHHRLTQSRLLTLLGLACWALGRYTEAAQWFHQDKNLYLNGYSWLLSGDLNKAYTVWTPLLTARPNHWCGTLLGLVSQRLNYPPTFLGVRNHTEMDIYHLSQAGQLTFLESYVHYRQTLGMVNPEAFKLIGRALCYAGSPQWGLAVLLEAQRHCTPDPEVYYHLAQGYHRLNQPQDARLMLHQALMMQPAFIPAQDLLAEIDE